MTYHILNSAHLGDCILQLNFVLRAARAMPGDSFVFYSEHSMPLEFLIEAEIRDRVILRGRYEAPEGTIETWIGAGFLGSHPKQNCYNEFYPYWFDHIAKHLGIDNPVPTSDQVMYTHPWLENHNDDRLQEMLPHPLRGDYDILFVDCHPMSGQFTFVQEHWDSAKVRAQQSGKKVVSIRGAGLNLLEIAAVACRAKHVIAVCTGPLHVVFNSRSLKTVKRWNIFHRTNWYTYVPGIVWNRESDELCGFKF